MSSSDIKIGESLRAGRLGIITDVQNYTINDGPGIRTMVFFKGCPLSCRWCHNPETWSVKPELMQCKPCCVGCGNCIKACTRKALSVTEDGVTIDRALCDNCGECAKVCHSGALELQGRYVTVDEAYDVLMEDECFYRTSNGGITLSGGECTMQPAFVINLLRKLKKKGVHTTIETCGFCKWETLKEILEYVDLVLYDIKVPDDEKSRYYTGQTFRLIHENLGKTRERGKEVIIRYPMIPGVNDDAESIHRIIEIAKEADIKKLHIMPFHQTGKPKWEGIGRPYFLSDMIEPENEDIQKVLDIFLAAGLDASVGGAKS